MGENKWTYIFGAIGALAGIVYLWQARTGTGTAQAVTNVFPPLSTDDSGETAGTVATIPPAVLPPDTVYDQSPNNANQPFYQGFGQGPTYNIYPSFNQDEGFVPDPTAQQPTSSVPTNTGATQQSPNIVPYPVFLV